MQSVSRFEDARSNNFRAASTAWQIWRANDLYILYVQLDGKPFHAAQIDFFYQPQIWRQDSKSHKISINISQLGISNLREEARTQVTCGAGRPSMVDKQIDQNWNPDFKSCSTKTPKKVAPGSTPEVTWGVSLHDFANLKHLMQCCVIYNVILCNSMGLGLLCWESSETSEKRQKRTYVTRACW